MSPASSTPSPRTVRVAALQLPLGGEREANVSAVLAALEAAADDGAQIILPPELFEGPYFCQTQDSAHFARALPLDDTHPTLSAVRDLCRRRGVVVPVSLYERAGHATYNSVAIVDATGDVLGVYRKAHIPDGPGYSEKYYFRPGDTGFRVWRTRFGAIGVGICWDQWYPEAARAMALMGAELLLYPTAIGSEPNGEDTADPWRRAMVGHAVSNAMPVIAANRIGTEGDAVFYGTSFIADPRGDIVSDLDRTTTGHAVATFDLDALAARRDQWGFFRDRRPELYGTLATADGRTPFGTQSGPA